MRFRDISQFSRVLTRAPWKQTLGATRSVGDFAISTASNRDLHKSPKAKADEERETGRAHADQ